MQENPTTIKELAVSHKLTTKNTCDCGGHRTEKYSDVNNRYMVAIRIFKNIAQFRQRNKVIIDWMPLDKFKTELEKFYAEAN